MTLTFVLFIIRGCP